MSDTVSMEHKTTTKGTGSNMQTSAIGYPYVRRSSNPASLTPWQVRRNRPDQTFDVLSEHATEQCAHETREAGLVIEAERDYLAESLCRDEQRCSREEL